jgi:hypothetical protein
MAMTPDNEINLEAAQREGLTPINCPKCNKLLALMNPGGASIIINQNVTGTGKVRLPCNCGSVKTWRASDYNGKK